jgi:hypothetical protein
MSQNYINHIALVLDASSSMQHLTDQVPKVADNQIAYLGKRSQELDQETRVTVYTFADEFNIQCLVYDKDVLRLPSIKGLYKPQGNTALIDATLKALDDLAKTPELYGEHAFLTYVLTDGEENRSKARPGELTERLNGLPDHWTTAVFVPNQNGVFEAKRFGFPKDNIAVWDATTARGMSEAGERIRQTTEDFMVARKNGVRGSRNLFNIDVANLTKASVKNLTKLTPGQFRMLAVKADVPIATFVERHTKRSYKLGEAFYQLTKPVVVQAQKVVAIYDKKAHTVYTGPDARHVLGLPDYEVKISPDQHPNYDLFIQSTSVNRKLFGGTTLLLLSV